MALLELDNQILRDERFTRLGELTKKGKWDARARVEALWFDCIEKTSDVRTAEEIDYLTGWFDDELGSFAELMVRAKLAEQLLDDSKQLLGKYRIRGVAKRMTWLVELRKKRAEAGSKGGRARAESAARDEAGHFIPGNGQASASENPSTSQANLKQNHTNPGGTVPGTVPVPVSGSNPVTGSEKKKSARSKKVLLPAEHTYPIEIQNCLLPIETDGSQKTLSQTLLERGVGQPLVEVWVNTFPEIDWVIQEIKKALAWEIVNPRKKKKDFGKFMTGWMNRGWDKRHVPTETRLYNRAENRTQGNRNAAEGYLRALEARKNGS